MLQTHLALFEDLLLARYRIPATSGHTLHKGTPREFFVRDFLEDHLGKDIGIGTGEIIDAESLPGQSRNQLDVVLYHNTFPRLSFGGGINAFLAESVIATLEIKSTLTKPEFESSLVAAHKLKTLKRSLWTAPGHGYRPPSILSFIVAYDGPARMRTVYDWIGPAHARMGISPSRLPPTMGLRTQVAGPSLDGVFILGRGFLHFDNLPIGFVWDPRRAQTPDSKWVFVDTAHGALLLLFLVLTMAAGASTVGQLNPIEYLKRMQLPNVEFEP